MANGPVNPMEGLRVAADKSIRGSSSVKGQKMNAAHMSEGKTVEQNTRADGAEALWLAGQDVRRAWLSYPLSGLYMLFFGFIATSLLWGLRAQEINGARNLPQAIFFADFLFVLVGCILVVNALSLDYLRVLTADVFSNRTVFLRSLPLSTDTLVASRVISMLCVIPFTVPAFFLPVFLFTDLGELGLSYVWFCGVWLGWGLLCAGVALFCELGVSGRAYCWISVGMIAALFVGVLVVEAVFGISLVRGSAALASGYGPLPALVSLTIGVSGLWLLARLTVKRVNGREVSN